MKILKFIYIMPLLFSPLAYSQCDIAFSDNKAAQYTTSPYDVFNRDGLNHNFEIGIKRFDDMPEQCDVEVQIKTNKGLILYQQHKQLKFQLFLSHTNNRGKIKNLNFEYQFKSGNKSTAISYQLFISPEQFIPPGIYQTELEVILKKSGIMANNKPIIKNVRLNVKVASATRISFAGTTGRHHKVSFGELVDGKKISPPPAIIIQSSGHYGLEFSSKFQGTLRHSNNNKQWDIPYQLKLNKKVINLKQEKAIWYNAATESTGLFLPLNLSVPHVGERPTGRYRDTLTITLSPVEILF